MHRGLGEIREIVEGLELSPAVKDRVLEVYGLIAQAESKAHGRPVEEVHFHEVGSMDALADIVGVCLLMEQIAPEQVLASPVHVGSGQVRCAHGVLPVPAPATAHILQGVPMYGGAVRGELCTPTGAALLKTFVTSFGQMPPLAVEKTGYGMGKKDFEAANCVRAFLGDTPQEREQAVELRCNLDDMTPEELGFAMERLLELGALDVYLSPVGMKKSRPGVMLSCLCNPADEQKMVQAMFRHLSTLGIRRYLVDRYRLERSVEWRQGPLGQARVKHASGFGVQKSKLEYEDLASIAKEQDLSLFQVRDSFENRT